MAIEFRCSQCNQLLRVPDDSAGRSARCPKCQSLMLVPAASTSAAPPAGPVTPLGPPLPTAPASSPPKPPPGNPFGDAGGYAPPPSPFAPTAPSLNPYATPSAYGFAAPLQQGPRSGLPWEHGRSISSWWQTMAMIVGSPGPAFSQMFQAGGLGSPILFNFWSMAIPMALVALVVVPIMFFIPFAGPNNMEPAERIGLAVGMGVGMLIALALYVLLLVTVFALLYAAVIHVFLLLVGGAKQGFETTFRVVSFAQGAITPIGILVGCIPYIGGLIHAAWITVVTIIGISKAHEISAGKAVAAVLIPFGVCIGLVIAFIAFAVVMDANR
jgi:DNA-directed RNA polymerase subunit RPC12/RpoP